MPEWIRKLFKNKRKKRNSEELEGKYLDISDDDTEYNYSDYETRKKLIKQSCNQIINEKKYAEEAIKEYSLITSYISDIQKITIAEKMQKKRIIDDARNIVKILEENDKIKKKKVVKITPNQYHMINDNEDIIADEIKKLEEYEEENNKIQSDMKIIEGERMVIKNEKERLINYQELLAFLSKVAIAFVLFIYLITLIVNKFSLTNAMVPLGVISIVAASFAVAYVFISRKIIYNLKLNEIKMNKLITLSNKVKIKYYNSVNLLEYVTSKFNVKNAREFRKIWESYIEEKELYSKNERNSELLDVYKSSLIKKLAELGVADTEVWIKQVTAFVDKDEMKEIRRNLENRRKKTKARMDNCNKNIEDGKKQLKRIVQENSDYKKEVINVLKEYGLEILE